MIRERHRYKALFAATLFTTVLLTSTAAPAWADDRNKPGGACWVQAETGVTSCFADEAALESAVLRETGTLPVEEGSLQARTSGGVSAAAQYALARLYEDTFHGGDYVLVTGPTSTYCVDGFQVQASSMPAGFNDVVSSVRSYFGCQTRLYQNASYGGSSATFYSPTSLGGMNNIASSYRVS
jgi:hypothetical protein